MTLKVWQSKNNAEKYLSATNLISHSKDVFDMLRPEIGIHMRPVPHSKNRLKAITIDDVRTYLEKYGLQQKDLMKLLDIDKTSINCSLNEDLKLTRYQKVMFLLFI